MMFKIRFQDKEWLFIGESLEDGGAITTEEAYQAGTVSYAHLCDDGVVKRFCNVIGGIDGIEMIGPADVEIDEPVKALVNILLDDSWDSPRESEEA